MAERQCAVGLLSLEKKKKLSFVSDGMTRRHHTFVRNRSLGKLLSETFLRFVPRSWWLSSTETEGETRDRWIGRRAELISAVDNLLPFCLSFFFSFFSKNNLFCPPFKLTGVLFGRLAKDGHGTRGDEYREALETFAFSSLVDDTSQQIAFRRLVLFPSSLA